MIEFLGISAVAAMVLSYALEDKNPIFILIFAVSCAVAAFYAYLISSYPFMIAEGLWSLIAFRRWFAKSTTQTKPL